MSELESNPAPNKIQYNTPNDGTSADDTQSQSQNSNDSQTQTMESPSDESDSIWGRLIPVASNHPEASLNQVFEFREPIIMIGRDDTNDITLNCKNISSKHCKLIRQCGNNGNIPDTIWLEDTSSNGTWLNKKKISKKKVIIRDGFEIVLVPGSKKRQRKKLSYFFKVESKEKRDEQSAKSTKDTLESKYYTIRQLGKGAFSTVKLVQDREDVSKKYALKVIDRSSWQRMKHATNRDVTLLDEVEIMRKANHPNIVKVYEYFEEEKVVNVILDYCDGGDMLEYIQDHGAYSSKKGAKLFKQLIQSVEYLHDLKIAHRDLKPDNILLSDKEGDHLKLSDFGISREQTSAGCGTIIGTPLYQAPEVHLRRQINGYDGTLADYWSLGIILYVMLVAAPPISTKEPASKIIKMAENKTLPWYDEPIPETAKDLIYQLLSVDPQKRITAKQIYKHPWINGYDTFESFQQDDKKEDIEDNDDIDLDHNHNHNNKNNKNNKNNQDNAIENDDSNESINTSTNNVQKQLGSFELNKFGTSDSKQEEEQNQSQSQQTQNGEEEVIQKIIMPKPNAVTPHLSSSVDNTISSMDSKDSDDHIHNEQDQDEDNDITMQSVLVSATPSLSVTTSTSTSTSTSTTSSSLSSTSTNSRKRRAHFDDESDPQIVKPPAKKQRSDPNGIEQKDLIPVQIPSSKCT